MTWSDMTADWTHWFKRVQQRFPHLDDSAMRFAIHGRDKFETYLAGTHNMTRTEVREELDDLLYVETLVSEILDPREKPAPI